MRPVPSDLPPGWDVLQLRYVAGLQSGSAITSDDIEAEGAIPVFGGNGLRGYTDRWTHTDDHVLIGRQGALCGNVNVAHGPFWASEHAIVVTPSLYAPSSWLASVLWWLNLGDYSLTAAQPGISVDVIGHVKMPVPPPDERRAIAEFLDRETAQIDAMIDAQQRLVETVRSRRVATIWHGVTKGVDPADLVDSRIDWIGEVPSHWHVARLRNSIESAEPGVWGDDPRGDDSDVKCVRVADFDRPRNRVIAEDVETMRSVPRVDRARRMLTRGDLLLEKSGGTALNPVGFVVRYESDEPAVYSNFISRLKLAPEQDSRFWNYAHAASYSTRLTQRSVKQTTGIQNLDQSAYFNEVFPYPPLEEQSRIADHLDRVTAQADRLIEIAERATELLRERRAAVITAAVTGRLDPRTGVERVEEMLEGAAL